MPARHREVLQRLGEDELTITKHPKGCLVVFTRSAWLRFRERLMQLPMSADNWRRLYLGGADDVKIDGSSRVLVSPELRKYAGINGEVSVVGNGAVIELWDAARHAEVEASTCAGDPPESIQNFVM